MTKIPIGDIVTKGKSPDVKHVDVTICIADGAILREFTASLFELSKFSSKKFYNLNMYMCGPGESEQGAMKKIMERKPDLIVFIKPFVGFNVKSIDDIIKLSSSDKNIYGIAVPRSKYCFESLVGKEIDTVDKGKSICGSFDLLPDGKINIDKDGIMKVLAFQNQDVVCLPTEYIDKIDISQGLSKIENIDNVSLYLCTNYTCSNNGVEGCLLNRLMYVMK